MTTLSPPMAAPSMPTVAPPAPPGPPVSAAPSIPILAIPARFDNAAEWHRALGGVPLERIIFNPWPGTATEADLLRYVEAGDRPCELIDGTLVEKPMGFAEGQIAMRLGARLTAYADDHDLGVVSGADSTLRMKTGQVRLPDVVFVSYAHLPGKVLPPEKVPTLTVDLAVEVLSESNTTAEIAQKLRELFQSGTRLAWVVDPPTRTVAVYHGPGEPTRVLRESESLDGESVMPGFSLPIAALFKNIAPSKLR